MSASRSGNLILINIHDFLLNKDDLMSLLYIDEDEADEAPPEKVYKEKVFGPPKKRGRKPLYEKFPGLIDVVNNFVKQHSFAAHGRRRETTGTGLLLLKQLKVFLDDFGKFLFCAKNFERSPFDCIILRMPLHRY